ncbi:Membrane-bound lytic murein transglycosylase B precursor [Sodalis glossinidius str. 'morsitans']|uniref:Membrane-bound lytic murein transglycosylase B n=1 Tax=Sodalis glossinidius (strain morsitans) TaxID=343509 RepID=A0A193QGF2_SODGM|nr:Membrane-bound lytic murein transglycosylase B precursor [Sodalis glossinidius str. 'morsitans']
MCHLAALVPFIALLAARPVLYGDFATNPNVERFIDKMVSKHGFDRQALHNLLAQTQRLDGLLRLMNR